MDMWIDMWVDMWIMDSPYIKGVCGLLFLNLKRYFAVSFSCILSVCGLETDDHTFYQ